MKRYCYAVITFSFLGCALISNAQDDLLKKTSSVYPSMKFGGTLELDLGKVNNDLSNANDGTNLKTAKIKISGDLTEKLKYKTEFGFKMGDNISLKKALIEYHENNNNFTLGRFSQDYGLSAENKFPESSLVGAIVPSLNDGIRYSKNGDNYYASIGYALAGYKDDKADKRNALNLRVTYAPQISSDKVFHVGTSFANLVPKNLLSKVNYSKNFDSSITNNAVTTGDILDIKHSNSYGGDVLFINGPFSLQSEYVTTRISRQNLANLRFDAYYLQLAYSLTGETRNYSPGNGEVSNIDPKTNFDLSNNTYGAFEFALRYSFLDLNKNNFNQGKLQTYAASLNWYINENLSTKLSYIHGITDANAIHPNNKPRIILLRTTVSF